MYRKLERLVSLDEEDSLVSNSLPQEAPNRTVFLIILLLGLGLLTPWNVTISSYPYFVELFSATDPVGSKLAFLMTSASTFPSLPLLFLMVWFGDMLSTRTRIVGACLVQALLMILLPLCSSLSPYVPILLAALSGMTTSVLQSSVMGLVSSFPPTYSQGFMLGQGYAGILASFGQIIVQGFVVSGFTGNSPTYIYFAFAASILASGAIGTVYLHAHPFARPYLTLNSAEMNEKDSLLSLAETPGGGYEDLDMDPTQIQGSESASSLATSHRQLTQQASVSTLAVFKKSWKDLLTVFLVFLITFLVFPGVMVYSTSYKGGFGSGSAYLGPGVFSGKWWTILIIGLFNLFDTCGRSLPGYSSLVPHLSQKYLLPAVLLRALAVPIFLGCAWAWFPWMGDVLVLLTTIIFSFSNGYLASCKFKFTFYYDSVFMRFLRFPLTLTNPAPHSLA